MSPRKKEREFLCIGGVYDGQMLSWKRLYDEKLNGGWGPVGTMGYYAFNNAGQSRRYKMIFVWLPA